MGGKLRGSIFLVELDFVESPFLQRHVLVNADPVPLLFGIHEHDHSYGLDLFVDQHVSKLEGGVEHCGIIGKAERSPSKLRRALPDVWSGVASKISLRTDRGQEKFEFYYFPAIFLERIPQFLKTRFKQLPRPSAQPLRPPFPISTSLTWTRMSSAPLRIPLASTWPTANIRGITA